MNKELSKEAREGVIENGTRVTGKVGVFYADREARGTVLNQVAPDCIHVQLDDGERAVVPTSAVEEDVASERDAEPESRCPACGDPMDYCQGHGLIGDPYGHAVLTRHDWGFHDQCNPAGCEGAPPLHFSNLPPDNPANVAPYAVAHRAGDHALCPPAECEAGR